MTLRSLAAHALTVNLLLLVTGCRGAPHADAPAFGAIRASVVLAGSGGPPITRVHVTVAPSGESGDLVHDALAGEYRGAFVVRAGEQTITAEAFSGADSVGVASATVTVEQSATRAIRLVILDTSARPAAPDHGPIVTALTASDVAPEANLWISVAASALDPDGQPIAYAWTDGCGGTFADPTAASTTWRTTAVTSCTLTVTATAAGLQDAASLTVTTQEPTGTADVQVAFVPAPYVAGVSVTGGALGTCTVLRGDADATCRPALARNTPTAVDVAFDPVPDDSGATVGLTSSCGGAITPAGTDLSAGTASFAWTSPDAATTCLLEATVARLGLTDRLSVGLYVGP